MNKINLVGAATEIETVLPFSENYEKAMTFNSQFFYTGTIERCVCIS